jgi:hypothetical protein
MIDVTEVSAQDVSFHLQFTVPTCFVECASQLLEPIFVPLAQFRKEIILTSQFKHPNVIGFVGCCWSRELTALVLEWAPGGSLQV